MQKQSPLVSIIIPTFKRTELLKLAIESVINQTYREWEMIIIGNISDRDTQEMMKLYVREYPMIKSFFITKSNIPGISSYLNYGISKAAGKYIARLDDDDTWFCRDKLTEQVQFLESNPDYVLVGGGIIMIDSGRNELKRYIKKESDAEIRKYSLLSCPFDHPAVVFKHDAFIRAGGYGKYEVSEDWELFLKLGMIGKIHNIQKYYVEYMQAGQGISFSNETKTAVTIIKLITAYRKEYPNYLAGLLLGSLQLLYSFLPAFLRNVLHYKIRYIKRKYF